MNENIKKKRLKKTRPNRSKTFESSLNRAKTEMSILKCKGLKVEEDGVSFDIQARGGGYFHIRRSGGLDLASSLEAKFGAGFSQVHQIRGKIWGVLSLQDAKIGKESQFWGHLGLYLKSKGQNLGYLSPIFLEAKFGAPT